MAEWISGMKDMVTTFLCGRVTPTSTSPVSLEGCGELEVVSRDSPVPGSTMINFSMTDCDSDSSSTSSGESSPKLRREDGEAVNGKPPSKMMVHCKGCLDVPVRTKAAQGVFVGGQLYVGGGYVEESKLAAVIYKYDPLFQFWDSVPPCPVKSFGMSLFNRQLVVVGGKETRRLISSSSNKIFSWDIESRIWRNSIPPMTFARISPVVISYDRYLIVAGGNKGSLDYNMEVYDSDTQRWTSAPPLPVKCFPPTSAVIGRSWYLLNQEDGTIVCGDIPSLLEQVTGAGEPAGKESKDTRTKLWTSLPKVSCEPTQITTVSGKLLVIAQETSQFNVSTHLYNSDTGGWSYSHKLPNLCGHSSTAPDGKDGTYLFGGEGGAKQYSNKMYRLTLHHSAAGVPHKSSKPPITFCL